LGGEEQVYYLLGISVKDLLVGAGPVGVREVLVSGLAKTWFKVSLPVLKAY